MDGNCDKKRFVNFNKAGMISQVKIALLTSSIPFGFEKMKRTYTEVPIVVPENLSNYLVESLSRKIQKQGLQNRTNLYDWQLNG